MNVKVNYLFVGPNNNQRSGSKIYLNVKDTKEAQEKAKKDLSDTYDWYRLTGLIQLKDAG